MSTSSPRSPSFSARNSEKELVTKKKWIDKEKKKKFKRVRAHIGYEKGIGKPLILEETRYECSREKY